MRNNNKLGKDASGYALYALTENDPGDLPEFACAGCGRRSRVEAAVVEGWSWSGSPYEKASDSYRCPPCTALHLA